MSFHSDGPRRGMKTRSASFTFPNEGSHIQQADNADSNHTQNHHQQHQQPLSPHNLKHPPPGTQQQDLLTVFQAAPLAFVDEFKVPHPIGLLDFRNERDILLKTFRDTFDETKGNRISLTFEIATTDRLGAFLARKEGRILHFSCHGHPEYLVVDDGWGAVQKLGVEQLREWIFHGGQNLKFVFVSACYSQLIGQAFVDAGVPHVVCCRNQPIRNDAAVEFEKAFYRYLASGWTLRDSFQTARQEVSVSPIQTGDTEMEKFCLLPAKANHDVPIFFTDPVPSRSGSSQQNLPDVTLSYPEPPEVFVGRDLEMFNILNHLKDSRLVRVCGSLGIGKSSIAKACCQYMSDRLHVLDMKEILWVPFEREKDQHPLMGQFADLFERMEDGTPEKLFLKECQKSTKGILEYLDKRKTLLVIEAKSLSKQGRPKLSLFLQYLFRKRKMVQPTTDPTPRSSNPHLFQPTLKVILIHRLEDGDEFTTMRLGCKEAVVHVKNLDIGSTVNIFARMCPHVVDRTCPSIADASALGELLIPRKPSARPSRRLLTIFEKLGMGIPERIIQAAKNMKRKDYQRLIDIGLLKEERLKFSSRAAILKHMEEIQAGLQTAVDDRDFVRAHELQGRHNEVEALLEHFPDLHAIKRNLDVVNREIEVAITYKDWLRARDLQSELLRLETVVQVETDALVAFDVLDSYEEDEKTEWFWTRTCLDAKIEALERELQQAADKNEFKTAREIDAELRRLVELKPYRPSKQEWQEKVASLAVKLDQAKKDREWDRAEFVFGRLKEAKSKLASEKEAEITLGRRSMLVLHNAQSDASGDEAVLALLPSESVGGVPTGGDNDNETVSGDGPAGPSTIANNPSEKTRTTRPAASAGDGVPGAVAIPGIGSQPSRTNPTKSTMTDDLDTTQQAKEDSETTTKGTMVVLANNAPHIEDSQFSSQDASDKKGEATPAETPMKRARQHQQKTSDEIVLTGHEFYDEAGSSLSGISPDDIFPEAPPSPTLKFPLKKSPKPARKPPPRAGEQDVPPKTGKHNRQPARLGAPPPGLAQDLAAQFKMHHKKIIKPEASSASVRPAFVPPKSNIELAKEEDEASAVLSGTETANVRRKSLSDLAEEDDDASAVLSGTETMSDGIRMTDRRPSPPPPSAAISAPPLHGNNSTPSGRQSALTATPMPNEAASSVPNALATSAPQFNELGQVYGGTLHATAVGNDTIRIEEIVQQTINALSVSAENVERVDDNEPETVGQRLFHRRGKKSSRKHGI